MARGLTHIRRGTASTLKKVNNTRSQVLGNFILKREKRSDSSGGAENKSSLEMRESGITKAIDLGADLERMYSCERKAEIQIISMVSFTGILVNKEVTSKLAMTTLLESMSLFKSSWTKEKESVIMRELVVRGVKSGIKNLASLYE